MKIAIRPTTAAPEPTFTWDQIRDTLVPDTTPTKIYVHTDTDGKIRIIMRSAHVFAYFLEGVLTSTFSPSVFKPICPHASGLKYRLLSKDEEIVLTNG